MSRHLPFNPPDGLQPPAIGTLPNKATRLMKTALHITSGDMAGDCLAKKGIADLKLFRGYLMDVSTTDTV